MNRKQRKAKLIRTRRHSGFYKKAKKVHIVGKRYTYRKQARSVSYSGWNLKDGMSLEYLGCGVYASELINGHSATSANINIPSKYQKHCIHLPVEDFD